MLEGKNILLIISGGIAAYKALELIRLLRKNGAKTRCILTQGGAEFITPLSVASLSEQKVYTDLWSLTDETEMGHIRLSRESDLIVIAPASADLLAKMSHGLANDLASTTLLAADKPILVAPAMNHMMWQNAATQENLSRLKNRGVSFIGPNMGEMACGESGVGRMSEPDDILKAIQDFFFDRPLNGLKALVTSGPTFEKIDPVRFLGNRSSGKQGHAIASALYEAGAEVTLVSGPVSIPSPAGVSVLLAETADDMLSCCEKALPADIVVCAAAVSDWKAKNISKQKLKKRSSKDVPNLNLVETPDILHHLSVKKQGRPRLIIGFAAETENVLDNAMQKREKKQCDWLLANAVDGEQVFGKDENKVIFITQHKSEEWPLMHKNSVASHLVQRIIQHFKA